MSANPVKQWFPQFLIALDRAPMAGLLCAAALLFGVTLAWTRSAAAPNIAASELAQDMSSRLYEANEKTLNGDNAAALREGSEIINQPGYFNVVGDRIEFESADNKCRFIALENRNLERVVKETADNPNRLQWIVSGALSQFRGSNFILISRVETKSPTPTSNAANNAVGGN